MSLVAMYTVDRRVSSTEPSSLRELHISEETAAVASDIVAEHFGVNREWDKKLMKCMFLDNPTFNKFDFDLKDNPELTFGVTIETGRKLLFNASPEEPFVPFQRPDKLSILKLERTLESERSYVELGYEQIKSTYKTDYSVVALFNCDTFKRFAEAYSRDELCYSGRIVEKLALRSML